VGNKVLSAALAHADENVAGVGPELSSGGTKNATKRYVGYVAIVCILLGCFAPLVSVPILGSLNYFHNGSGAGILVVLFAAIAAVTIFKGRLEWLLVPSLGSLLAITFTFVRYERMIRQIAAGVSQVSADTRFAGLGQALAGSIQFSWAWPFLYIGSVALLAVGVSDFRLLPRTSRIGPLASVIFLLTTETIACVYFFASPSIPQETASTEGRRFRPAWEAFGEHYDYNVGDQKSAGGATKVVFENPRGNVRVVGADTTDVKVTGRKAIQAINQTEADRGNDSTPLEIVTQGDTITVRTNQDHNSTSGKISEDLQITVPSRVSVQVHGNTGDYDVSEINGGVELRADRSDVRLNKIGGNARVELQRSDLVRAADLKGNLDIQGKGSDIELENVAGQVNINGSYSGNLEFKNIAKPLHFESPNTDLLVAALPGQISMDLGELTGNNLVGPIHLTTKSRDVKIEDFTNSLELETERGDIELQPKHLPLAKIEARSHNGQINLVLPDKGAFQLNATSDHGEAVNEFGSPIQKRTDGRSSSLKATVGQGASIHVVTERGTVTVRKAAAP